MQRKEPADIVFYNVKFNNNAHEAIAIYNSQVVNMGTIPYIFSNYKGYKDYNAQGNFISNKNKEVIEIGDNATGIIIHSQQELSEESTIWSVCSNGLQEGNIDLLDPHWEDH